MEEKKVTCHSGRFPARTERETKALHFHVVRFMFECGMSSSSSGEVPTHWTKYWAVSHREQRTVAGRESRAGKQKNKQEPHKNIAVQLDKHKTN